MNRDGEYAYPVQCALVGDFVLNCFSLQRDAFQKIFRFTFNTVLIGDKVVESRKNRLDIGCMDENLSEDFTIKIYFEDVDQIDEESKKYGEEFKRLIHACPNSKEVEEYLQKNAKSSAPDVIKAIKDLGTTVKVKAMESFNRSMSLVKRTFSSYNDETKYESTPKKTQQSRVQEAIRKFEEASDESPRKKRKLEITSPPKLQTPKEAKLLDIPSFDDIPSPSPAKDTSVLKETQQIPPPPPLPPCDGIPPPPPPPPILGMKKNERTPSKPLKRLHWKTIPNHKLKETVK